MPLPILDSRPQPTFADLLRFYHRCELHWFRQSAADETVLDVGTALSNRAFPRVHSINVLLDASLPEGFTPAQAFETVQEHYRTVGAPCWTWIFNPSLAVSQTQPLIDHLLSL